MALSGGFRDFGGRNESELEGELSNSEPCRLAASISTLLDVLRTMYRSEERYASGRSTYLTTFLQDVQRISYRSKGVFTPPREHWNN